MNHCDESEKEDATRQRNLKQVFCGYNLAKRFCASMVFLLIFFSFYVGLNTCSINTGTAFGLICTTAAMRLFSQ